MTEIDGGISISLAVPAKWIPWASIGDQILWAIGSAGSAVAMIWYWRHIRQMFPGLTVEHSREFWLDLGCYLGFTVIFCLSAAHSLTMHLRWGQVPKTLKVTRHGAILSWLGFRRMREQSWKPDDVLSVDMKKAKDVFTRKTVYRLRMRLRTGWPRVILISTKDVIFAEQIRERLREILSK
jgi:hypothetical protein